jgi:molecular chaperone GrpE
MAVHDKGPTGPDESEEPVIRDKRKINPETGEARDETVDQTDGLIEAEGPDVELSDEDAALLAEAERDLVGEYRDRAARAPLRSRD